MLTVAIVAVGVYFVWQSGLLNKFAGGLGGIGGLGLGSNKAGASSNGADGASANGAPGISGGIGMPGIP